MYVYLFIVRIIVYIFFWHFEHFFNILKTDKCSSVLKKQFTKQLLNTPDQNTPVQGQDVLGW